MQTAGVTEDGEGLGELERHRGGQRNKLEATLNTQGVGFYPECDEPLGGCRGGPGERTWTRPRTVELGNDQHSVVCKK